eukprot:jgi/Mesvir1/10928/Mv11469-RA.1
MSLTQMARSMRSGGIDAAATPGFGRSAPVAAAADFPMDFPDPLPTVAATPVPPSPPFADAPPPTTHYVGSAVVEGRKSSYSIVAALAGVSVAIGVLKFAPTKFPRWFENRNTGKVDKIRVNVAGLMSGIVTYGLVLMAMNFRK